MQEGDNLFGIARDSNKPALLVIGGCRVVDCAKQIATNRQARIVPDNGWVRTALPRSQRPAGIVAWPEEKSGDTLTERVISWVLLTSQDEQSGFDKKTRWTKSYEVHLRRWTNRGATRATDEIVALAQTQICKQSNP